jgi:hypothetical protein
MSSSCEINEARVELLAYTADQVCAALQISKVTLWRLEKRGLLRPLPQLRHKRYPTEAVRRFATPR